MSATNEDILLAIREVDSKISSHGERLAVIETQMTSLVGNGQPGRISKLEEDVEALQESKWQQRGFLAAFAIILEPAAHWLMHKFHLA